MQSRKQERKNETKGRRNISVEVLWTVILKISEKITKRFLSKQCPFPPHAKCFSPVCFFGIAILELLFWNVVIANTTRIAKQTTLGGCSTKRAISSSCNGSKQDVNLIIRETRHAIVDVGFIKSVYDTGFSLSITVQLGPEICGHRSKIDYLFLTCGWTRIEKRVCPT